MHNVISFPTKAQRQKAMDNENFQHDRSLEELRHELTMLFLQLMQQSHSIDETAQIINLHRTGNAVMKAEDIAVIQDVICQLELMDKVTIPTDRRKKLN